MEKQAEKIKKNKKTALSVAFRYLSFLALVSTIVFNTYYYLNLKNDIERRLDEQFELASSQIQLGLVPQLANASSDKGIAELGTVIQPVLSSILASSSFDRFYLAIEQKAFIGLHREDLQRVHVLSSMPFQVYHQRQLVLLDQSVVSLIAIIDSSAQRKKLLLALMNSVMLSFMFYLLSVLMLLFFFKLFFNRRLSRAEKKIERVSREIKNKDELQRQMESQKEIYKAIKKNKGK